MQNSKTSSKIFYPSEHEEQVAFVNWFKATYKDMIIFAVPNGGTRSTIQASRLKKEGVMAGIPDLVVVGKDLIIFVEMKMQKGGILSKVQKQRIEQIESLGHSVIVGYGFLDAMDKIKKSIDNPPNLIIH